MFRFTVLLLCVLTLWVPEISAQSRKELAAQNLAMQQRIERLESRLLTGDPAAERLMQRMDALETSQRALTGDIERLRYERDNLTAEVEALERDIRVLQEVATEMKIHLQAVDLAASQPAPVIRSADPYAGLGAQGIQAQGLSGQSAASSHISGDSLVGGNPQPSSIPAAPTSRTLEIPFGVGDNARGNGGGGLLSNQAVQALNAQDLSTLGQQRLQEGDFQGAQDAFRLSVETQPDASDIGETYFWLGESYLVTGRHADAADAYIQTLRRDPQGEKSPDAMIRLATALRELGNQGEACQTLGSFNTQFPQASSTLKERARVEATRTGC